MMFQKTTTVCQDGLHMMTSINRNAWTCPRESNCLLQTKLHRKYFWDSHPWRWSCVLSFSAVSQKSGVATVCSMMFFFFTQTSKLIYKLVNFVLVILVLWNIGITISSLLFFFLFSIIMLGLTPSEQYVSYITVGSYSKRVAGCQNECYRFFAARWQLLHMKPWSKPFSTAKK